MQTSKYSGSTLWLAWSWPSSVNISLSWLGLSKFLTIFEMDVATLFKLNEKNSNFVFFDVQSDTTKSDITRTIRPNKNIRSAIRQKQRTHCCLWKNETTAMHGISSLDSFSCFPGWVLGLSAARENRKGHEGTESPWIICEMLWSIAVKIYLRRPFQTI